MDPIYLLLSGVTILVATALFFDRWERAQWNPTHKGWFAFLPVYIRDPEGECEIDGRFGLGFLVPVAAWIQNTAGAMRELFDPSLDPFEQPGFTIKLTGRVAPLRPFLGSWRALLLFGLVMLPLLACGSIPPDRLAYNSIDSATEAVQTSMRVFNDLYQAGRFTEADREKVLTAYKDYQAVARAAASIAPTLADGDKSAIAKVSAAAVEAIRLIEHFTRPKSSGLEALPADRTVRLAPLTLAGGLSGRGELPLFHSRLYVEVHP